MPRPRTLLPRTPLYPLCPGACATGGADSPACTERAHHGGRATPQHSMRANAACGPQQLQQHSARSLAWPIGRSGRRWRWSWVSATASRLCAQRSGRQERATRRWPHSLGGSVGARGTAPSAQRAGAARWGQLVDVVLLWRLRRPSGESWASASKSFRRQALLRYAPHGSHHQQRATCGHCIAGRQECRAGRAGGGTCQGVPLPRCRHAWSLSIVFFFHRAPLLGRCCTNCTTLHS